MAQKSEKELLEDYKAEYSDWFNILKKYHENRFETNYKQFTACADTQGTEAKISDPLSPELVERVIQRLFARDPKFFVLARGKNIPREVSEIMAGVADYFWTNPDMIQKSGTVRSRLKVIGREFCVLGQSATQVFYNTKTDCPDFRVIPIEDIIFDPSKTLKTSPVYYLRQFVSLDYLKENVEIDKNGKKYGYFKNISKIEKLVKEDLEKKKVKQDSSENRINRSGSDTYDKTTDKIELITRYEGSKGCRFIQNLGDEEENVLVQEFDLDVLGDDPLDFVMDIEVPKEPYAFGMLDFLNGLTHAKDLFLNQLVDYGAKVLNPPTIVDPTLSPVNKASLVNLYRLGGLVFASKDQINHLPMPTLGNFGFEMLGYLQQRAEGMSNLGGYTGGVSNQQSDKTQGTATGITALISKSMETIKDRQINLEESIIEPIVNKWLKMAGALMGDNEIKYVFISGQSPKWVKATKGFLTGKMTIYDLWTAELMTDDELMEMEAIMVAEGKEPAKELVIDVDWIIRVEVGSMAEEDKQEDLQNYDTTVQAAVSMGIQLDMQKVWIERAIKAGIKEPEQYLMQGGQMPIGQMGQPMAGTPTGQPQGQPPPAQPLMVGSTPIQGFSQGPNGEIVGG